MHTNVEKISDMEAEIMKVVWKQGSPTTFAQIRAALNEKFTVGNQSIQTMIKRLVQKSVLHQEKREVYYYAALVSEEAYTENKTKSFVEKVFNGNAKGLLQALISYDEISEQDVKELQDHWRKGKESDE